MNTTDKQYAGQRLAPTHDSKTSFVRLIQSTNGKLKVTECCDGWSKACEDSAVIAIDAADKVTEVIFDKLITSNEGEEVTYGTKTITHATGFDRDDVDGITEWLQDEIEQIEIDAQLMVSYDAGNLTIKHIGVLQLVSVKHGANVATLTHKCTFIEYCTDKYNMLGGVANGDKLYVFVNGVKTELAGTYPYDSADAAANTTTAGNLKTELEAKWAGAVIAVSPNDDCGCYKVTARTNPLDKNYANGGHKVGCVGVFE